MSDHAAWWSFGQSGVLYIVFLQRQPQLNAYVHEHNLVSSINNKQKKYFSFQG